MLYRNKALSFVVTLICETCKSKGGGMICGRSAISMLFACILLAAPACVLQSSETKPERIHSLARVHSVHGIVWSQLSRLPHGATYSRFTPWRSRKKGVLQEVNPKINEDSSFGSPILPNRFITCAILEPVSCRPGTRSPLRCRLGSRLFVTRSRSAPHGCSGVSIAPPNLIYGRLAKHATDELAATYS